MKKLNSPEIVWTISGLILGAAAILSFASLGKRILEIVPWLGLAMLITGILNIILYMRCLKEKHSSKWLLADGMTAALLSIFPLFNQISFTAIIPFYFCVWDLFSGILRLMEATEQKGEKGWRWFCTVGILEILAGVIALIKPVEETLKPHVIIGLVLLIQAAAFLYKAGVELSCNKIKEK